MTTSPKASLQHDGKSAPPVLEAFSSPTTRYVLAFVLLALAAIASHLLLVQSLSELDEDSLIINASGRQRMLSEQTFRLAGELRAAENVAGLEERAAQLRSSITLMRESHQKLSTSAAQYSDASGWDRQLYAAYFDGAPSLDDRLQSYFAALEVIGANGPSSEEAYRLVRDVHQQGLLNDLDQLVRMYEAKAQAKLQASEDLHVYLMLAMLALLLLEALFVFRPLIRRQELANQALVEATNEAQAELAARNNILAAVSHEIRTPLSGVLGIIDQLKRERSPVERERAFDLVEDSCEALLDTLDAILQQSRLGQGASELADNDFSPRAIAGRVAELFRPVARRKALIIEVNATSDRKARGDDARIQQVLANLVSNAVKFTQSGAITIFVQEPGTGTPEWTFVVSDTGAGMDNKRVEALFQPFGHSSHDTLGRAGGAGLGLAITRDLVEAMGGRIEVESEPGEGSSFTVLLPLDEAASQDDENAAPINKGRVGLLIDRASDRVQVEAVASQSGYTVFDLGSQGEDQLDNDDAITVIVDAGFFSSLDDTVIAMCQRIIILGEDDGSVLEGLDEKISFVSHSQLARSLSDLLE